MESLLFFQLQLCSWLSKVYLRGAHWGKICTKKLISRCEGQSSYIAEFMAEQTEGNRVVGGQQGLPLAGRQRERNRDVWLTTISLNTLSLSQAFSGHLLLPLDEHRAWQLAQIAPPDKKKGATAIVTSECRFYAR